MKIKSIKTAKNLKGKKVFLRVDFNVPIEKGKIKDDFKIIKSLPTIRYLLRYKCRLIIATHLGNHDSALPVAKYLKKILGVKVTFVEGCVGSKIVSAINKIEHGEIVFLENLRFCKEEERNDKKFAKKLSELADIYVNNAFAVSHRNHASVSAIKKFIPSFAGLLLEEEILNLNKILVPKKPLVVVMGGAKVSTKLSLLKNLEKKADHILVGGVLANVFLASRGISVGKFEAKKDDLNLIGRIKNNKKIILPIDAVVIKNFSKDIFDNIKNTDNIEIGIRSVKNVNDNDLILDIGPETIRLYAKYIKKANTIIWNGPMGMFEIDHFRHGTLAIGRVIASRSQGFAYGVTGGGETIEALKMTGMMEYMDWISTGGGAMLAYLGKEKMPGLEGLVSISR